ncbi:hypothetical protein AB5N19_10717 [Seiridium cardinale]
MISHQESVWAATRLIHTDSHHVLHGHIMNPHAHDIFPPSVEAEFPLLSHMYTEISGLNRLLHGNLTVLEGRKRRILYRLRVSLRDWKQRASQSLTMPKEVDTGDETSSDGEQNKTRHSLPPALHDIIFPPSRAVGTREARSSLMEFLLALEGLGEATGWLSSVAHDLEEGYDNLLSIAHESIAYHELWNISRRHKTMPCRIVGRRYSRPHLSAYAVPERPVLRWGYFSNVTHDTVSQRWWRYLLQLFLRRPLHKNVVECAEFTDVTSQSMITFWDKPFQPVKTGIPLADRNEALGAVRNSSYIGWVELQSILWDPLYYCDDPNCVISQLRVNAARFQTVLSWIDDLSDFICDMEDALVYGVVARLRWRSLWLRLLDSLPQFRGNTSLSPLAGLYGPLHDRCEKRRQIWHGWRFSWESEPIKALKWIERQQALLGLE